MRQNNQQGTVACGTEALQNEMTRIISSITVDQFQKESHNLFMQCEACLQAEVGHFQHLL
jgi:hypothetical protein